MSDHTPNLSLPFIQGAQAQKHITHNEALRQLDVLTQTSVISRSTTVPQETPANGDVYLIPANAEEPWAGRENEIAAFQDGAFAYFAPKAGWRAYVEDEAALLVFDGSDWNAILSSSTNDGENSSLDILGVNASADSTNRLSVTSPAVLSNNESGDIRSILNKENAENNASFVFQTGFFGRAEIGLTGDDNFHFRVSPDGVTFRDSLTLNAATGRANFASGFSCNGILSESLTAANAQSPVLRGPDSINFNLDTERLSWVGRFISISDSLLPGQSFLVMAVRAMI